MFFLLVNLLIVCVCVCVCVCVQCGSSRVVYVGQIPNCKYTDEDILKLAEPYGKVRKYFLNRIRREVRNQDQVLPSPAASRRLKTLNVCLQCFIEMDRAEDAEKMAEACKAKLPRFNGKRLTIYVSRKYRQLKHGWVCPAQTDLQRVFYQRRATIV